MRVIRVRGERWRKNAVVKKDWNMIGSSRFDPRKKQYADGSPSPKLFQADTIESDFEDIIVKAWKCPECGTFMFFDRQGRVISEYKEDDSKDSKGADVICNYVVFDDYSWSALTDSAVPDWKLTKHFKPKVYAKLSDSKLTLIDTDGYFLKNYKRVSAVDRNRPE